MFPRLLSVPMTRLLPIKDNALLLPALLAFITGPAPCAVKTEGKESTVSELKFVLYKEIIVCWPVNSCV